jgi:hypothetical protein
MPSRLLVVMTCASVVLAPGVLAAGATQRSGAAATATPASTTTTVEQPDQPRPKPSERERTMRRELRELARAWADGGGTFGYPFWEKARQRWARRQITTPMYREYVTGYRDRLDSGCELVDRVDTSTETSTDVRELVLEACDERVEALRTQQRSLDEQVRRDSGDPDLDAAASEERIGELDADALEHLQTSFRATREAMDLAQSALDEAGLERLAEDAFI